MSETANHRHVRYITQFPKIVNGNVVLVLIFQDEKTGNIIERIESEDGKVSETERPCFFPSLN